MLSSGPQILTFALENWPHNTGPATRASKPKVRTGCVTCNFSSSYTGPYLINTVFRRRRIKCDETKPSCQNCFKRRVTCEGYKPKPPNASSKNQLARSPSPSLLIEPSYQSLVFTTQLQKDHFDQWLSFAVDILVFPSELITNTIPQIAQSDLAVRNAAFAIGAAALGSSTREERLGGKGPYYVDALQYYNRALKLTAKSPPTEETFHSVLMTCLLFFMFEALQGDRRAALMHLNYGNNILDQYERRIKKKRDPLVEAITSNFQRLTLQSWSHNGDHPKETEEQVPWCCRGHTKRYAVDEMPDSFESLDEAHRWWEITQHHVIHHAPIMIGFRVEGTGNKAPSFPPNQSLPIPPEQVKGYNRFIKEWRARFKPLMEAQEGREVDGRERLKTLGLRIHSTYLSIPTVTANYTDLETLAQMTPAFREYVTCSEEFLHLQKRLTKTAGETFTMDSNGPTWPLGAAAMLCADQDVQADAVRLFREFPRRDGLWDTQAWLSMLQSYKSNNPAIAVRGGERRETQHLFDVEVVYEDKSVVWIKQVEDPTGVGSDNLEYRINLP
ncbi:aspercryptin biosynthesis cluster-specific transcription regulator atnN [Colletotrichum spaethianum]|uniref:Aspercryptin biosynthesis cluster-specific transcription regulator atnN n=1 Tax=Colletotrichum spaethianum TaxID=700344 RepID=A0AA37L924_9PEZI|nr:aspercryptin biosynthesis cluster-specific transcription regulator atnN [Colletotrichum spaethianum]GKT41913.1 aspercryptin biosynthesis cluster-specific transcription regulator atnN [Colletotrichum spaethianum]